MKKLILTTLALLAPLALGGAWGYGSFDNDDAADWMYELQAPNASVVTSALERVSSRKGYVEAPDCSVALAAAEVVAAALGRPHEDFPDSLRGWVRVKDSAPFQAAVPMAQSALKVCLSPSNSELRQLWSDSRESEREWLIGVRSLEERLDQRAGE